jgi:hypothetical protein
MSAAKRKVAKAREDSRREYARGYSAGRRNVPYTLVRAMNPAVSRGWGAGQEWLMKEIGVP